MSAALTGPQQVLAERCRAFEERRDLVISMLNQTTIAQLFTSTETKIPSSFLTVTTYQNIVANVLQPNENSPTTPNATNFRATTQCVKVGARLTQSIHQASTRPSYERVLLKIPKTSSINQASRNNMPRRGLNEVLRHLHNHNLNPKFVFASSSKTSSNRLATNQSTVPVRRNRASSRPNLSTL